MSMFDKIKSMMGVPDDDGYDDDGIDYMDEEPEYPQKDDYEFPTAQSAAPRSSGSSNVVNINSTMQLQVVLVKPEKFENAAEVADHLRDRRTVVLNLEALLMQIAAR